MESPGRLFAVWEKNMAAVTMILCIAAGIALLAVRQRRKEGRERIEGFRMQFGKLSSRRLPENLRKHAGARAEDTHRADQDIFYVDDRTWADLEMDRVFDALDTGLSPAGREYLYTALRLPLEAAKKADILDKLAEGFCADAARREKTYLCLEGLRRSGRLREDRRDVLSLYEYLDALTSLKPVSCVPSASACAAFFASIVFFIAYPTAGILVLMAVIFVNLASYFHIRGKLGSYFRSLQKAVQLAGFATDYSRAFPECDGISGRIAVLSRKLSPLRRNAWLLEAGTADSSLPDIIMSYVRMLTHCDLIYFCRSARRAGRFRDDLMELYDIAGLVETALAVASLRSCLPVWCRPEYDAGRCLKLNGCYHPLIPGCVPNSAALTQNLLLTGSNASGKSTFLRTAGIAVLLGEALDTVPAESALMTPLAVMSSMSVTDSLESGASLYMAEIRSLKRITDAAETGDRPLLVLADEILRGTNTAERIAGGAEILRWLGHRNCLVMAATHDGELTWMLAGDAPQDFVNMHFPEDTAPGGVVFSYTIQPGPAETSNAIRLLERTGFPEEITGRARKEADAFLRRGQTGCNI